MKCLSLRRNCYFIKNNAVTKKCGLQKDYSLPQDAIFFLAFKKKYSWTIVKSTMIFSYTKRHLLRNRSIIAVADDTIHSVVFGF